MGFNANDKGSADCYMGFTFVYTGMLALLRKLPLYFSAFYPALQQRLSNCVLFEFPS